MTDKETVDSVRGTSHPLPVLQPMDEEKNINEDIRDFKDDSGLSKGLMFD